MGDEQEQEAGDAAMPPVRLRVFQEELTAPGMFGSVCADDYAPAMARVAGRVPDLIEG